MQIDLKVLKISKIIEKNGNNSIEINQSITTTVKFHL